MSALLLLRAVAAARLLAVAHALGVERAADDLVADSWQVPHPAAAHQHDRVLLQVVPDARDVRGDLDLAGKPDPRHLAQGGVRLLGRGRVDARANPAALGAALQRRGSGLGYLVLAALADQLLDSGHRVSVFLLLAPCGATFLSGPRRAARVAAVRCTAFAISRASSMPVTCWFLRLSDPRGRACRARHGTPAPAKAGWSERVGLRAWPLTALDLAARNATCQHARARVPGTRSKNTQRP